MSRSLKDKVVLITGASSGFGAHAAHLFAEEGAKVVLAARRLDRLQKLVNEIQDAGGEALAVPVDVTSREEIHLMVETTLDIYGKIDILFNNAGFGRLDWLENLGGHRDIQTQVDVNLTGLIQVTREVLPHMIKRHSGHIINMSSVAGWVSPPLYSIYSATKFGVRGFTIALRREVKSLGIDVSGIYPGPAVTEFGEHTGDYSAKKKYSTPKWAVMDAEYVAEKVVALAQRPRRSMILPWWFMPIIWFDQHFPRISDFFQSQFAKRTRS
jgi:NADP-dependent 3-hydroxy acid dehydrogenase YdfG